MRKSSRWALASRWAGGALTSTAVRRILLTLKAPRPPQLSAPLQYATALAATLLTVAIQYALLPEPALTPFLFFFSSVAVVSWLAGRLPGLLAVLLAALVGNFLFVIPYMEFSLSGPALTATGLFAISATIVGLLCASFRDAALEVHRTLAEQQRVEEALRESEQKFSLIFERAAFAAALSRLPEGVLVDVNEAWVKAFGYTKQEAVGRTTLELNINPDAAGRARVIAALQERGLVRDHELTLRTKSGDMRTFSVNLDFVGIGGQKYLLNTAQDITERKRAEAEAEEARNRLALLAQVSRMFAEDIERSESVLESVAKRLAEAMGDVCVIRLLSEDRQSLQIAALHCKDPAEVDSVRELMGSGGARIEDAPQAQVLTTNRPLFVPLASPERFNWQYLERYGAQSVIIVPVRAHDELIGTLGISRSAAQNQYIEADLEFAQDVADRVALAIYGDRLITRLRDAHGQLEALSRRLLDVQEEERRHLARELHDEVGQILTGVKMLLELAPQLSPARLRPTLEQAIGLVDDLSGRVRQLSLDLRPPLLDELGLLAALAGHLDRFTKRTGIGFEFEHGGLECRFSPALETAVYRLVQEALTNVARHSGAVKIGVRVQADEQTLSVEVIDDGVGFDPASALNRGETGGLIGMRERVALLGGKFSIESTRGKGTCLTATIPRQDRPLTNGKHE